MTPVKYTKLKPNGKHLDEDDREYLNYKKRCNSDQWGITLVLLYQYYMLWTNTS